MRGGGGTVSHLFVQLALILLAEAGLRFLGGGACLSFVCGALHAIKTKLSSSNRSGPPEGAGREGKFWANFGLGESSGECFD